MKRADLFDLFGTLVLSPPAQGYRDVVDSIAGITGVPTDEFFPRWMSVNDGRLNGSFGSSEGEIGHVTGLFGITLSDAQMAEAVQLRRDTMASWLTPKPGCIEMLRQLSASQIETALVSDCVFDVPAVWSSTPPVSSG